MLQVLSFTVFALLLARLMRAPKGTWRWIAGGAALTLLGSQLLPAGHPFRSDVAESARAMCWLALALVPVGAYALVIRRLRRRTGVGLPAARPEGLVQIDDDTALAADTRAALAADDAAALGGAPETLSLGWRMSDGALAGHLRLMLIARNARIEMLRVAPAHRGQRIGSRLLQAAETEARTQGATSIGVVVGNWQGREFFEARGYAARSDAGTRWLWLEKELV